MNKKDIEILSVILASPLIIGIIIAGIFNFDLTKGEWITLVTSCVSTFAAIFLGFMVFFQNENHKNRSEEMAKEHEKQEQLYRDEEQKNRDQDLIIKANPVVYLNGISRFDFESHIVVSAVNSSTGNNLYETEPKEKFVTSSNYFSFDLEFKNDFGKMVDFITILSAKLTCTKGSFIDDNYEEKIVKDFSNFDDRKALIKVEDCGNIVVLLQLFSNNINDEEVKYWLQDETLTWFLRFTYCLSNSCGVEVGFESQIVFNLDPNPVETPISIICKPSIKQIVTWQRSAITISKEKTNELNT